MRIGLCKQNCHDGTDDCQPFYVRSRVRDLTSQPFVHRHRVLCTLLFCEEKLRQLWSARRKLLKKLSDVVFRSQNARFLLVAARWRRGLAMRVTGPNVGSSFSTDHIRTLAGPAHRPTAWNLIAISEPPRMGSGSSSNMLSRCGRRGQGRAIYE